MFEFLNWDRPTWIALLVILFIVWGIWHFFWPKIKFYNTFRFFPLARKDANYATREIEQEIVDWFLSWRAEQVVELYKVQSGLQYGSGGGDKPEEIQKKLRKNQSALSRAEKRLENAWRLAKETGYDVRKDYREYI